METANSFRSFMAPEHRISSLVLVVVFSLPFGWQAVTNSSLLLLLVLSVVSLKTTDWQLPFKSSIFWASAIFFLFSFLSLTWAENKADGFIQLETKLLFFFGPLLIVALQRNYPSNFKDLVLKTFIFANVSVGVLALVIAAFRSYNQGELFYIAQDGVSKAFYFTYVELASPFMHPGYLSTYMGIAILVALYYFFVLKNKRKKLYLGCAVFMFSVLFLLQGRINILAILAVLGVAAIAAAIKFKMYKLLLLPLIPVVFLVAFMLFGSNELKERYFQMPDFSYDISGNEFNSATYRLAEWSCAMDVIKEHPLAGTGLGDNRVALLNSYENRGFWRGLEMRFNAHNQYIETTISTGLVGLFFLLLLFIAYARLAFIHKDWLTLSALAFFGISMLTESMFERAWAVMLFTIYFPLMLILGTKNKA